MSRHGDDVCSSWMSQHGTVTMCAAVGCLNTARQRCVQRLDVSTRHGSGACRGWLSRLGTARLIQETKDSAQCARRWDYTVVWSQRATRLVVHCSAVVCTVTAGHLLQHSVADSGDEGLSAACLHSDMASVPLHSNMAWQWCAQRRQAISLDTARPIQETKDSAQCARR